MPIQHAEQREAFIKHVNSRIEAKDPKVGPHALGERNFSGITIVKSDPALDHVNLKPAGRDVVRLDLGDTRHWQAAIMLLRKNHFTRIVTFASEGSEVQMHVPEKAFGIIRRMAGIEPAARGPLPKAKELIRQRINELLPATADGAGAGWQLDENHVNFNELKFVLNGTSLNGLEEGKNALTLDLNNSFHFSAANSVLGSRGNFVGIRTGAEPGSDVHIVLPEERFRMMLGYIRGPR